MKALITRPEPDAAAFAALCQARRIAPIICPIIELEFFDNNIELSDVAALAFTSANGVRAVETSVSTRVLPVFAVGEGTARAARQAGFADVRVAGGDVKALSDLICGAKNSKGGTILHIAGRHRADDLIGLLNARGVRARVHTAYTTIEATQLPEVGQRALRDANPVDWVALFSPRTAILFRTLVERAGLTQRLGLVKAACISDAVAETAGVGWSAVEVASERTAASVIEIMARDLG